MGKVRSSVDLGRLSEAASRPGIDPRRWLAKGIVQDLAYDPDNGLFADVQLQPDGDIETVLVGTEYAGDDFGQYWPIKVDDIVLIAFPSGDPAEGGFIVSKMWSGSEKPPKELSAGDTGTDASDLTNDPTTRIEDGATLRVVGKAGANVKIELDGSATYEISATGGSKINMEADTTARLSAGTTATLHGAIMKLGDNAALGIARLTDKTSAQPDMIAWMTSVSTAITTLGTTLGTAFPPVAAPCAAVAPLQPAAVANMGVITAASTKASSE